MFCSSEIMKQLRKIFKKFTSLSLVNTLIISLLAIIPVSVFSASPAHAVSCASGMSAQNNLKAEPAHGQVFYIDSGVTPKVDAAYVGYKITNNAASGTIKGLWAELSNFTGGKVALANPADKYEQLPDITAGAANYKTSYFLLKALGATTTAQGHTLKIYDRRPDLNGASVLLSCDFSFAQVQETIKASANKINTVSASLNTATATLGGTLTVSVTSANTGKVGSGKTPDFSLFWVSPAAVSTWPTRSLRLESTTINLNCTGSNPNITLTNTLSLSSANTACFTNSSGSWTSSYVFRIIGPGPSSLTPYPVAMIASGTQYKHSDISGLSFGSTVDLSGVSSSAFTVTVSASSSVVSSTSSGAVVEYTIKLHTTSATDIYVDEVIDNVANGVTFVTGSAKLNGASIGDPIYLASESGLSPPPLHYIGPFTVNSSADTTIVYRMNVPCSVTSTSFRNVVYAKIGDQILGSSTTTLSASIVTTISASSSCTVTTTTTTDNITPTGQTYPATSVTSSGSSSSATLNGYANAYGQSNVTYRFRYSLDPNLVNNTTLTTSTSLVGSSQQAVTASISGLAINKTYYFRIEVSYIGGSVNGTILNFVTPDVLATPSVLTGAISNLSGSGNNYSVTLNATINPHLNTLTPLQFEICVSSGTCTSSAMPSSPANGNSKNVLVDNGSGSAVNLTLSGSGDYPVTSDNIDGTAQFTGLNGGTTYYYRVKAVCDAVVTTYCPNTSTSFYGAIRTFTVGAPIVTTTAATVVARTTATLNGTYDANGAGTPTYYFTYCPAGVDTCSSSSVSGTSMVSTSSTSGSGLSGSAVASNITGLTGNTVYYFQLLGLTGGVIKSYGDILTFTTLDITTSSLPGGVVNVSYSTSIVGAGGSGSYSFSATGLPSGLTLATTGVLSGTPSIAGTTTISVTITDLVYNTTYTKNLNITIIGVTTSSASSIAATSATANGSASVSLTTPKFCYSSTDPGGSFDIATCSAVNASGTNSAYTGSLTSLTASTTYYFQLTGVYSGTQYYGAVLTFRTIPTVTTASASNITINSATIGGSATEALTSPKLCYSTTNPASNFDPASCTSGTVAGTYISYTAALTGLNNSTTYYFQMTGQVNGVYYYGAKNSFKTLPVATTNSASSITATAAVLNGSITESATAGAFCFSTTNPSPSNFTYGSGTCATPLSATDAGSNNFTFSKTSLTASTTYYFQFFGTVGGVQYNGVVQSFATLPSVTTSSATSVATTTAVLHGSGTETLTSPQFCLSSTNPSGNFVLANCSPVNATAGASNTYSYNASGLTPNTTYYFQLFGSVGGTSYSGSVITFTTVATYTITVTQGSNGTISPGTTVVASGANQSFTISPTTGYHIVAVTVDGTGVGTGGTYSFTNITADHTITASYAIDTFTVTYFNTNADGSPTAPTDSSSPYNYGSTVTVKSAPSPAWTRTGYTFTGWNTNSSGTGIDRAFSSTFTITTNVSLYPHWVLDGSKTVTFHKNDGVTPETTSSQSASTATNLQSNSFSRSGYSFARWNGNSSGTSPTNYADGASYDFLADIDLYAVWNQIFTITFNSNGGGSAPSSLTCTQNVDCSTPATLPSVGSMSRTHYTFTGWTTTCDTGTVLTGSYSITSSLTLCAYWTADATYTVTYNGNGNTSGSVPVDGTLYYPGDTVTVSSATLTKTGYTRDGWYSNNSGTGGNVYSGTFTMGTSNVIIYAKWNINNYTVTYNGNGNTSGTAPIQQSGNYNTTLTISNKGTLANTGYVFQYWNSDSTDTNTGTRYNQGATFTIPASNTNLYAIWSVQSNFTVTFHGESNTGGNTNSQSYNGTTSLTANGFTRTGYTFTGWATSSGGVKAYDDQASYNFVADADLYAHWSINTYSLSYDCNNGSGGPSSHSGNYATNLTVKSNTCTYSGYTFLNWGTSSSGGTSYAESSTFTIPASDTTLYAIWQSNTPSGGNSAPVVTPTAPRIISISANEVCAVEGQLTLTGTDLAGASVTVDGLSANVISSTTNSLIINLPTYYVGVRTLTVTNSAGSASTTVKYVLVDRPLYQNFIYPQMFKGQEFSYSFSALDAAKYSLSGVMPSGLTLNPLTGEISGTPGVDGTFFFTLVASNVCGVSYLHVYMFVDKEIPNAFTCSVLFNVPRSDNITPAKLTALKNCLGNASALSPSSIDPVIFISGGIPLGLTPEQSLAHPRYKQIVDLIKSMGIPAQIYVGAFSGSSDTVQLNVYWPEPTL